MIFVRQTLGPFAFTSHLVCPVPVSAGSGRGPILMRIDAFIHVTMTDLSRNSRNQPGIQ
jgi:hypothetical protein